MTSGQSATNVQTIHYTVCTILEANRTKKFNFGQLCQAVAEAFGLSKPNPIIQVTVKAMLVSKVIDGNFHTSGQVSDLRYKTENSGNEDTVPRARYIQDMQVLEERHRAVTKTLSSQISSLETELENLEKDGAGKIVKVVVSSGKKQQTFEETFHSVFEDVVTLANLRENIFMYGPTGSGKTFIGSQVAKVLGLNFYFLSCTQGMSEAALVGRLLPTGEKGRFEYSPSEFVKAYEGGGIFLIDEIDAADPNILLVLNTALANNQFAVPGRLDKPYAKKHPDFICIAAANTIGNGSDRQYSGRSKLDASTLDRFSVGKVFVDYDSSLEKTLCPDDALRFRYLSYRKGINENRLERSVSTRFLQKAYTMFQAGWSVEKIDKAFFLGWREDEINRVKAYFQQVQ